MEKIIEEYRCIIPDIDGRPSKARITNGISEPSILELQFIGKKLTENSHKGDILRCRECHDSADFYVMKDVYVMPWYYCSSCANWLKKLGHSARFVLLPACLRTTQESPE